MTDAVPVDAADLNDDGEPATKKSPWQTATVIGIRPETERAKTFRFALPQPSDRLAGQHYVIRLMAPDGYTAQRSYSVANPPGRFERDRPHHRTARRRRGLHVHARRRGRGRRAGGAGPIGRWFVWEGTTPALLVGGGSGVVPLMAMLRLARKLGRSDLLRLVVSVRTPADLYYSDELPGPESNVVYTRSAPPGTDRPVGRLNAGDLEPYVKPAHDRVRLWLEWLRRCGQLLPRRPRRPDGAGPRWSGSARQAN